MSKKMLIDTSQNDETRMAIVNDGKLIFIYTQINRQLSNFF